jgi:hypothetical protein
LETAPDVDIFSASIRVTTRVTPTLAEKMAAAGLNLPASDKELAQNLIMLYFQRNTYQLRRYVWHESYLEEYN